MVRSLSAVVAAAVLAVAFEGSSRLLAQDPPQAQEPLRAGAGNAGRAQESNKLYVVQMVELPVSSYTGGITGFAATKPPRGRKINRIDPAVITYAQYLDARHDEALGRVGGGRKVYDYRTIQRLRSGAHGSTGRGAEASPAWSASPRTKCSSRIRLRRRPFSASMRRAGSGTAGGVDDAGEDIVIGVIDSGIWPESQSFSDRTGPTASWQGRQDSVIAIFPVARQMYTRRGVPGLEVQPEAHRRAPLQRGVGRRRRPQGERPWEFASPRDYNGHGTHTASTAGGNNGVMATGPAAISAASAASRRARGSPSTRRSGPRRTARRPAVHVRSRRGDRSGRRRRRGRDQLFDQRHDDQLPRPSGNRISLRGRRRRLRVGVRGQQRAHHGNGRASLSRGSPPSRPARTIAPAKDR